MLYTLANVVFKPISAATEHPELFYKATESIEDGVLKAGISYDFSTYFNSLSVGKWKKYSIAERFFLQICCSSPMFEIELVEIKESDSQEGAAVSSLGVFSSSAAKVAKKDGEETYLFAIPETQAPIVAFTFRPMEDCVVESACYCAEVDESKLNEVNLNVAMTTFNNEQYALPNIEMFRELIDGNSDLQKHLHVHIVDNGRSLDVDALSDENISVHPNDNVGGAGGFTRGMIESLKLGNQTHVLLMDDDVSISPESILRTYNLLRLRNDTYQKACISGAMLQLENPIHQYEDVGYVRKDGRYSMVKEKIDISKLADLVRNETTSTEIPNAYGAWWYCCIPIALIEEKGLPLPLFIRCDDVEYGMRIKPTIMTMNGIGIWHSAFAGRFRASVDHYQYTRNFLILNAVNNCSSEQLFMLRFKRTFNQEIHTFAYENAELLLDGLADYLKGPNFIAEADGSAMMKSNGARNEKLLPLDEVESQLGVKISDLYEAPCSNKLTRKEAPGNKITRFVSSFLYDPHSVPLTKSSSTPVVVSYDGHSYLSNKTKSARIVVALNEEGGTAGIRYRDDARYASIMNRYKALLSQYNSQKKALEQEYKKTLPELTSVDFWKKYLKIG